MASHSRSDTDTVNIAVSNLQLSDDLKAYKPHLQVLIHVLSRHTLAKAFFHPPPSIPLSLLQDIVSSATKCASGYGICLHNDHRVVLDKKTFTKALNLPYHTSNFDQPSDSDLKSMIYNMGYMYDLPKLFHMSKGHISPLWQCLIHYIIKCLTGKMGGTDQLNKRLMTLLWSLYSGRKVDYAGILFDDFIHYVPSSLKPTGQIHSARFWAICIEHIYQNLELAFPDPRSDDDKLVMVKAKPYTAKTDTIFGEIRRLPTTLLNLADPTHPAVISHINSTEGVDAYPPHSLKQCEAPKKLKKKASDSSPSKQRKIKTMSEPSSKDFESEHLDERQNSPGSEDTQDDPFMEENQNQPHLHHLKRIHQHPHKIPELISFQLSLNLPLMPPNSTNGNSNKPFKNIMNWLDDSSNNSSTSSRNFKLCSITVHHLITNPPISNQKELASMLLSYKLTLFCIPLLKN
ncbi:hypothetical protein L1887_40787 [Cichorium endivia]|nr:hypothetical protein L1887_40787 [Cichorium endivia]